MKLWYSRRVRPLPSPAVFGRLCVETIELDLMDEYGIQPSSGGCVLKRLVCLLLPLLTAQPSSGGCVLKQKWLFGTGTRVVPAVFGRLCVETNALNRESSRRAPAVFGRLCVETSMMLSASVTTAQPSSGGCVLKLAGWLLGGGALPSRLRAAVC